MDTDRNLLFGVLALQADLIDHQQFIEACLLWTSRKDVPLADLLVERGWIVPADKAHVDYLLGRKLQKHGGDPGASLAAIPDNVKRSLAALADDDIQRSLAELPGSEDGLHQAATVDHVPQQGERYARLRLHATGGIGRVWLARDRDLGRDVALKELRPERAEQSVLRARFLQEAQITGQLEHPGIIPVYELARRSDDRQPFYTMRFVKGRTLSEAAIAYHQKRSAGQADALELPALLNAFVTVCNTVAYAHSRGVIHRDLKGQNVILGDFGEVVVLDWGLAKRLGRPDDEGPAPPAPADPDAADSGHTVQGQALGTPAYMAPEQAAGRLDLIDRRTDVYGLGAVLYEILTGQPPFSGPDTVAILRLVQEEEPVPPQQLWPEVPPALVAVCLRALSKQPADRPATAGDLGQEVQGWQERERRKSQQRFELAVQGSQDGLWDWDLTTGEVYYSPRYKAMLGYEDHEFPDRRDEWEKRVHLEDLDRVRSELWAHVKGYESLAWVEFRMRHKDGSYRWIRSRAFVLRDATGRVYRMAGSHEDITDRKNAEEELRRSQERFELAVLGSQDGLWYWDVEADEVWYSPYLRSMLGYDEQEFPNQLGETEKRVHPDDHQRWRTVLHGHVTGLTDHLEMEYRIRHKDGSYRWVRDRGVALRRADGRAYRMAGSREDITDRKRMEELLRQTSEQLACCQQQLQRLAAAE